MANLVTLTTERVLERVKAFIEIEGYRKEFLAELMGRSLPSFYAHLQGKHMKSVFDFAASLATALGYQPSFFLQENFEKEWLAGHAEQAPHFSFSKGELSSEGIEGLKQIQLFCDLLEIYD